MKLYIIPIIVAGMIVAFYKVYSHGFELAELRNRSAATMALNRALEAEQGRNAAERDARAAAEERAQQFETAAEERALAPREKARRENPECPDVCYSLAW